MKIATLALLLFFFSHSMSRGEIAPERAKQLLKHYYENGTYSFDARTLTTDEKQYLIGFIRKQIVNDPSEKNNLQSVSSEALVSLGDEETTRKYLARYRERGLDAFPLIQSYDPKIIETLSTDLFKEDPWPLPLRPSDVDQPVTPISYRVCAVIELMLRDTPSFSKEVNEWANRNFTYDPQKGSKSLLEERTFLRKWWKENERFFKSKDYKSVKPGDELFGPQAAANPPENPQTPVAPTAPPASTPDQHSTAGVKAPSVPRIAFPALLVALALLLCGFLILRKGTKK